MTVSPQFGIFLDPTVGDPQEPFRLATVADDAGLDLLTIQDHPYQPRFYETWTLLTALAVTTKQIRVSPNVANLPLRPPMMLAKQAATLDILTGGRVELGIGAGAFWDGVVAYGGPKRTPAEAYTAFEDALHILRGAWDGQARSFSYQGAAYSIKGAHIGPRPAHRIPIWVGARGPKMLQLTGRLADGLLISMPYVPPQELPKVHQLMDDGAAQADRPPEEVRRGYNVAGMIVNGSGNTGRVTPQGSLEGTAAFWADQLTQLAQDFRMDTFIFWGGGDVADQITRFAGEVVPVVKERLGIAV